MLVLKLVAEHEITLFLDDLIPGAEPIVLKALTYQKTLDGKPSLRLGITADKRIRILRNEVIEREGWEKVATRSEVSGEPAA